MTLRRILIASAAGFLLLVMGFVIYAAQVRASAQALVYSASEIRSTADANRLVLAWRSHRDWKFHDEKKNSFGEHSYDFRVDNSWLYHLHIVPPTMVGMTVVIKNDELRTVFLVMYSGWEQNRTSGVWIQEWFGSELPKDLHVDKKNEPLQATIDFPSTLSDAERKKLFGLNTYCLVKPGGCGTAEEILNDVWSWPPKSARGEKLIEGSTTAVAGQRSILLAVRVNVISSEARSCARANERAQSRNLLSLSVS